MDRIIHSPLSIRLRRCLAWAIDWNIYGIVVLILSGITFAISRVTGVEALGLLIIPIFLMWFVLFIRRDVTWGSRSIGKRIMKLRVIDRNTGVDASKKQRSVRGRALFIVVIDVLFLLISGYSLGDRFGKTAVVEETFTIPGADSEMVQVKINRKKAMLIGISIVVAFIMLVVVVIHVALNSVKKSQEYTIAYDYLVSSMYFDYYDLEEDDVTLTSYSASTNGSTGIREAKLTFKVDDKLVVVYCIYENGAWSVSESASRLNTPSK